MLQWMGGSRRKVAATHTSMKKRQKQYFEQRRRQQQEPLTADFDSCADEMNSSRPCQGEHRSLDILNMLNLSTAVPEQKSSCSEGKGDVAADSSTLTHDIPGIGCFVGVTVEPVSSKTTPFKVSDYQKKDSDRTNNREVLLTENAEQNLSVFDLVADDPTSNIEEDPLCEAHMAFSVEGLGKINMETPENSPRQPTRIFSSWPSSSWKVRSRPDEYSVRQENNDLEKEVDAILESNKMFQDDYPFRLSSRIQATGGGRNQKLYQSREYTHEPYINDSTNFFPNTANINTRRSLDEIEWNERSILLDDGEGSMYAKDQPPFEMERAKADFLIYENDYLSDRYAAEHYLTKKRDYMGGSAMSNLQDSPDQRHRIPEENIEYPSSRKTLYFDSPEKFGFRNVLDPPVWPPFVAEEEKDTQSLRSDESCSSSAAWADETTIRHLKTSTRQRRDVDSFHNLGDNNDINNCFVQASREYEDGGQHLKRKEGSEEYVRQSRKSKSTKHIYSSSFHGGLEMPSSNWFAQGFTFTDLPSETSSMALPSSCPKARRRDPCAESLDFFRSESLAITPEREKPHIFVDLEVGDMHQRSPCTTGSARETWIHSVSVEGSRGKDGHDATHCLSAKGKYKPARKLFDSESDTLSQNKRKSNGVHSEKKNESIVYGMSHKVTPKAIGLQAEETSSSVKNI